MENDLNSLSIKMKELVKKVDRSLSEMQEGIEASKIIQEHIKIETNERISSET